MSDLNCAGSALVAVKGGDLTAAAAAAVCNK
jgi:hypothetical protein